MQDAAAPSGAHSSQAQHQQPHLPQQEQHTPVGPTPHLPAQGQPHASGTGRASSSHGSTATGFSPSAAPSHSAGIRIDTQNLQAQPSGSSSQHSMQSVQGDSPKAWSAVAAARENSLELQARGPRGSSPQARASSGSSSKCRTGGVKLAVIDLAYVVFKITHSVF